MVCRWLCSSFRRRGIGSVMRSGRNIRSLSSYHYLILSWSLSLSLSYLILLLSLLLSLSSAQWWGVGGIHGHCHLSLESKVIVIVHDWLANRGKDDNNGHDWQMMEWNLSNVNQHLDRGESCPTWTSSQCASGRKWGNILLKIKVTLYQLHPARWTHKSPCVLSQFHTSIQTNQEWW